MLNEILKSKVEVKWMQNAQKKIVTIQGWRLSGRRSRCLDTREYVVKASLTDTK